MGDYTPSTEGRAVAWRSVVADRLTGGSPVPARNIEVDNRTPSDGGGT